MNSIARDFCLGCYRPQSACFCAAIPRIENQTEIFILQHRRERFHAFNTARIVHRALTRSHLLANHTSKLAEARLPLTPSAGLLYLDPAARDLTELAADERPKQLVILDGTWHHVRTLVRELRILDAVPRYRLTPKTPGTYRIRKEPNAWSLSTLEATVAALRSLEPETQGLDQLLRAFDQMVEQQLQHPRVAARWRRNRRRSGGPNIPKALSQVPGQLVVAYGESTPGVPGERRGAPTPIFWVAQRLTSGEKFQAAIEGKHPLVGKLLDNLQLTADAFAQPLSLDEFHRAWSAFLSPQDTLVVYHPRTAQLLGKSGAGVEGSLAVKSVSLPRPAADGSLEARLEAEGLVPPAPRFPGRAGRRLAALVALVEHLHKLGAASESAALEGA